METPAKPSALLRMGAAAAWTTVALIPVQLVAFAVQPVALGGEAEAWFGFIRDDPAVAFVALDGLLVADYMLLVPIMAGLFAMTWRARPSWALLGLAAFLVAAPAFFASNAAVEMFTLAGRHAHGDEGERDVARAAAEALLVHSQGTVFHASYILGSVAGASVSYAMLASPAFHRVGAWAGIIGNVLGLGLYLPRVGLMVSALSGAVLALWFVYVGLDLHRVIRLDDAGPPPRPAA